MQLISKYFRITAFFGGDGIEFIYGYWVGYKGKENLEGRKKEREIEEQRKKGKRNGEKRRRQRLPLQKKKGQRAQEFFHFLPV